MLGCGDSAPISHPTQSSVARPDAVALQETYSAQLKELGEADQQDREVLIAALRQHGLESAQFDTARRRMSYQDSLRLREFLTLEKRYGWPQQSQVGAEGIMHAYLLIQHAPEPVQISYQDKIRGSYKRGELSAADYATYLDRMLGYEGQPQRYGTQYARRVLANGQEESYLLPIEELTQVDQRRATMQLEPLLPQLIPGTLVFKPGVK